MGESSAAAVSNNDVDHVKVNMDKFDSRGFQIDGVESIPLPEVAPLELPDVPAMADLPEMPDLDDLLNEDDDIQVGLTVAWDFNGGWGIDGDSLWIEPGISFTGGVK